MLFKRWLRIACLLFSVAAIVMLCLRLEMGIDRPTGWIIPAFFLLIPVVIISLLGYIYRVEARLEESVRRAENLAREQEEVKSKFISIASHEFRTPLSTVLSSAALLSKYQAPEDREKRDKHIGKIRDAVRRLDDLLEDLLSLGRLEEGSIKAEPAAFSLQELVDEILRESESAMRPGQEILLDHPANGIFVSDRSLLKVVLISMLNNAVKLSPEGADIRLRVEHASDGWLYLSVKDEGSDIETADLGLSIVKRYVQLLGGSVRFNSIEEQGTTVLVEIPEGNSKEIM